MKPIYIIDSYKRSFETTVSSVEGDGVVLASTAFYPQSGGQPSDLGYLFRGDEKFMVLRVEPGIETRGSVHMSTLAWMPSINPR